MRNDWQRAANGSSSWPLRRQETRRCRIASRLTESVGRRTGDTLEEAIDLVGALRPLLHRYDMVLLDCLTFWVSNLLLRGPDPGSTRKDILSNTRRLLNMYRSANASWIVVSNEVGLGVVPGNRARPRLCRRAWTCEPDGSCGGRRRVLHGRGASAEHEAFSIRGARDAVSLLIGHKRSGGVRVHVNRVFQSRLEIGAQGHNGFYHWVVSGTRDKRICDLVVSDSYVYPVRFCSPDFVAVELGAATPRGHPGNDAQLVLGREDSPRQLPPRSRWATRQWKCLEDLRAVG